MKKGLRLAAGVIAALAMMASTAYACEPIEPKDIDGHIEVVAPGGSSFAVTYFQENGCDWAGSEDLNGSDGVILDAKGMGGTKGNLTGEMGTSAFVVAIKGEFLNESCEVIPGDEVYQTAGGEAFSVDIPDGAVWFAVTPVSQFPSSDVSVKLHSEGKVCKAVKKKKKGRGR